MPDITILPANLATVVLDSFLYGLLFLLFTLTVYFLATRRTLADARQTTKHHFTSLAFIGVATLFLAVTVHWSIVIYQAFFAFIHLANPVAEDAFYADLGQISEIIKNAFLFMAVCLGDTLVTYRLWIVWGRNPLVVIFPLFCVERSCCHYRWHCRQVDTLATKPSQNIVSHSVSTLDCNCLCPITTVCFHFP
ncbi:hypothetical protein B0H16DRAFT_181772 [Mycena metata]|uniref:Uncharacterized protein n=1 Tax=Mycena metata TaxID=1033252 RepID=A0AAD7I120_9AGAR|nr:hypothetical protein B0H16DRAFT_181772 [Mycena metata]